MSNVMYARDACYQFSVSKPCMYSPLGQPCHLMQPQCKRVCASVSVPQCNVRMCSALQCASVAHFNVRVCVCVYVYIKTSAMTPRGKAQVPSLDREKGFSINRPAGMLGVKVWRCGGGRCV
jgi:hypothetical protein